LQHPFDQFFLLLGIKNYAPVPVRILQYPIVVSKSLSRTSAIQRGWASLAPATVANQFGITNFDAVQAGAVAIDVS